MKLPGSEKNPYVGHTYPSAIARESDPPIPPGHLTARGITTRLVGYQSGHMIRNHITTLKLLNKGQKAKRGNDEELSE